MRSDEGDEGQPIESAACDLAICLQAVGSCLWHLQCPDHDATGQESSFKYTV